MKKVIHQKIAIIVVVFLSGVQYAGAQTALPQIIPPTPISRQYEKFLGYPVSPSTGLAEVSLPLYNLQIRGLTIPFSLKYHGDGIKVDQAPGYVGYGWSLFPGFKITRTIMGKPDDIYKTSNIRDAIWSRQSANSSVTADDIYLANIALPTSSQEVTNTTPLDAQYDIFSVYLPNGEATFILKWDNGVLKGVSIPDSPVKIVPLLSNNVFYAFEVYDAEGIKYIFGPPVAGSANYTEGDDFVTGWMLRQMILPGINNTIDFTYSSLINQGIYDRQFSMTVWDAQSSPSVDQDFSTLGDFNYGEFGYTNISTNLIFPTTALKMDKMTFSNGNIAFTYNSSGMLTGMNVFNANNINVKSITFTQQLGQLTQVAIGGEGVYGLQYNSQAALYQNGKDYDGYYNGQTNYSGTIPEMTIGIRTQQSGQSFITLGTANREPDENFMKARILEKIVYPTGGWTTFDYEGNRYLANAPVGQGVKTGHGLRIKSISTYDPISQKTINKTYKYGANESGYGNYGSYWDIRPDNFIDESVLYGASGVNPISCIKRTLSSDHRFSFFSFNIPVWYDEVAEYADGGKTIYKYEYVPTTFTKTSYVDSEYPNYVLESLNNLVYPAPVLLHKEIYNDQNVKLQQNDYVYSGINASNYLPCYTVQPRSVYMVNQNGSGPSNQDWLGTLFFNFWQVNPFDLSKYRLQMGSNNLIGTRQHDYRGGLDVVSVVSNTYDPSYSFNKVQSQVTNSDNNTYTDNYYYPTSSNIPNLTPAQQTMVTTLKTNNRLTTLIENNTFKNSTIPLSSVINSYADWGNNVLSQQTVSTRIANNAFEARLQFRSYDNKGNLLSMAKEKGPTTSYIWGYDKQYPIAETSNGDLREVYQQNFEEPELGLDFEANVVTDPSRNHTGKYSGRLINTGTGELSSHSSRGLNISLTAGKKFIYSGWVYSTGPSAEILLFMMKAGETAYFSYVDAVSTTQINKWVYIKKEFLVPADVVYLKLRLDNNSAGTVWFDDLRICASDADMSTYTYEPLVGMTSAIDNKGQTIYYEYDPFQRLKYIRNQDWDIIKSYDYNYKP